MSDYDPRLAAAAVVPVKVPTEDLNAMNPVDANEWFHARKRQAVDLLERDSWDLAQVRYFAARRARRKQANIARDQALRASARAKRKREIQAHRKGAKVDHAYLAQQAERAVAEAERVEHLLGRVPVGESNTQRQVNDQRRSFGSVVQVETGNIEYRLRQKDEKR